MAKPRDTYKYEFKVGNKVVHGGITKDLDRRETEHQEKWSKGHIIPTVIDQNPCAHLRMPRDMIFHGWSMRLFQAWQHSATMSS